MSVSVGVRDRFLERERVRVCVCVLRGAARGE